MQPELLAVKKCQEKDSQRTANKMFLKNNNSNNTNNKLRCLCLTKMKKTTHSALWCRA